jgi:hypothetical protein
VLGFSSVCGVLSFKEKKRGKYETASVLVIRHPASCLKLMTNDWVSAFGALPFFLDFLPYSDSFRRYHNSLNPGVAKVEDAGDARRQGSGCSSLRRALDNAADAISSTFLKGKQHDCFSWFSGYLSQWASGYGTIESASSGDYCF